MTTGGDLPIESLVREVGQAVKAVVLPLDLGLLQEECFSLTLGAKGF
jgi:hypothetical protein